MNKVATNITLNPKLKDQATEFFKQYGLSLSTGISLLLSEAVLAKKVPFYPNVPNDDTIETFMEFLQLKQQKKSSKKYTLDEFKKFLEEV